VTEASAVSAERPGRVVGHTIDDRADNFLTSPSRTRTLAPVTVGQSQVDVQEAGGAHSTIPVEFLFTVHFELTKPVVMSGAPDGGRLFIGVLDGTVTGPRVNGRLMPFVGTSWITLRENSFADVESTAVITTDDHATIAMRSTGIAYNGPNPYRRLSVRFESGRDDYRWLNNVQAVGRGVPGRDEATWDVYALR
jgi:Protein of unknown function (DUF3237)